MQSLKPKLPLIIGGALVLLLVVGGGVLAFKKLTAKPADQKQAQPKKKKINDPVNVIPVSDRPYLFISPKDSRNVTITIAEVKKDAKTVDYELEYQTETNLEGAVGGLELGSLPVSKDILLGSCSAGGACRYHTNVKGGTILTKYSGGPETYALKSDWRYIENPKKESEFGSRDAKFQIKSPELAKQSILIITNSAGYPKGLTGTPISDPYALSTISPLKGKATITVRTTDEATSASIMGWDGTTWKEFKATSDGKSVTGEVDLLQLYVVVKK